MPAPLLDQHSRRTPAELLGLDESTIVGLQSRGVIYEP